MKNELFLVRSYKLFSEQAQKSQASTQLTKQSQKQYINKKNIIVNKI
jgi:hypothetical protein